MRGVGDVKGRELNLVVGSLDLEEDGLSQKLVVFAGLGLHKAVAEVSARVACGVLVVQRPCLVVDPVVSAQTLDGGDTASIGLSSILDQSLSGEVFLAVALVNVEYNVL